MAEQSKDVHHHADCVLCDAGHATAAARALQQASMAIPPPPPAVRPAGNNATAKLGNTPVSRRQANAEKRRALATGDARRTPIPYTLGCLRV